MLSEYCSAFVDIGANWGYYTYYIATKSEKPVYWFEPNSFLFDSISTNTAKNNIKNVKGFDIAIADCTGSLTFYINKSSDYLSSLIKLLKELNFEEVKVHAILFDDWLF